MKAIEKAGAATAECAMSAPKRLFAAICALLLAAMLVPTVGTQQAQAAEAKYSGNIIGVDTFAEHSLIAGKTNHGSTLSFMPVEGYEEFVAVPENERLSSEKWTAVSSNPSVLEATVSKSDDLGCTLNVKALAVGTATLTVTYEYGNWSAERSCEVIVLAQENKAASFTLNVNSITVPILANCPECGKVHQLAGIYSGAGALKEGVDYTITAQDPSAPLSSYYIQATSSSFAPAASGWVGGSNAITFGPEKVGSGKVTLQIVGLPSGYEDQVWQEATIDVTAENQNPTIEFDADKVTLYKGYSNLLMSYMTPNEAAEAVVFQHDLTLQSLIAEASSS
ncbi:MAG: hypothetical protein Q4C41_07590, partial [Eggerthellaceae bacterium]|nr:hypothetical protein [Eggerthellaceae bacterium]